MKKVSNFVFFIGFLIITIIISSCSSSVENNKSKEKINPETSIVGKWKLIQSKADETSDLVINFEEAGFFEENTILNDPKFAEAGIDKIQPIAKGQWKIENDKLTINKYVGQDSVKNENFVVVFTDANKMKLKTKKNKFITFTKYIEK